ncbi:MAG: hypothetical protein AABZ23_04345 [Deltaproteobacteria bacterium]
MKFVELNTGGPGARADEAIEVARLSEATEENLADAAIDAFIVDPSDINSARRLVKKIRSIDLEGTYLKPIFLVSQAEPDDAVLLSLADDYCEPDKIVRLMPIVNRVNRRAERFEDLRAETHESRVLDHVLRFIYTRDKSLEPVIDTSSRLGYSYPLIAVNFPPEEEHKCFGILEHAEKQGLLNGAYVDRMHLCGRCFSSFLNFRETCQKCSSSDLASEDLIHHFVCAYVGPESDFLKAEALVCPKCAKQLRHIGVDYDKPSVIYTCGKCNITFQDPKVSALCLYCKSETIAEGLIEKPVKRYSITSKGAHAAIYGTHITMRDILRIEGMVEIEVFQAFVQNEIERIKRVEKPSCLAYLQFLNFQEMYLMGAIKDKIFPEIMRLMKESIRPSDVLSYLNESTLLFLFPDTPLDGARIPLDRLRLNLVKLMQDNFKGFEPRVFVDTFIVKKDSTFDEYIKRIAVS